MHFDILSEKQKEVFKQLEVFTQGGYLAGGTSLALQLAHRKSYDFDLFLPKPLSTRFRFNAKQHFKKFSILVDTSDEFSFISSLDVKISFIFYPYKNLFKLLLIGALSLADWHDVALDKAHTIGRRGEWRDYVDLYFIVKNGFSIEEIVAGIIPEYGRFADTPSKEGHQHGVFNYEYKFEPNPEEILNELIPQLVKIKIHHMILESNASEHSARMVAMKNASESAEDLMSGLSLVYNKARQASITRELTEITAGADALN